MQRNDHGFVGGIILGAQQPSGPFYTNGQFTGEGAGKGAFNYQSVSFDLSRVVRTAYETKPASTSAYFCIKY
jgi:hypothetical protein